MEVLPYEVLYEIFTYIPVCELYFTLGRVCTVWKDVVMDRRLWRGRPYRPTECTTDEEIVHLLSTVTMLEIFDASEHTIGPQVFGALSMSSCNLTVILLSPDQALDQSDLEKLLMIRNLQNLSLHISDDETAKNNFKILGGFHSLKKLSVTGVFSYRCGVLMALATGCKCLQELNLGCLSCDGVTSAIDIAAILKLKGAQLISLTFTCSLLSHFVTDLIGQCAELQELHMNIYQSWVFVDFSPLLALKNLKAFSVIGCVDINPSLDNLFSQQQWSNLECLNISVSEGNVINIMFGNCPKLRILRIEGNQEVNFVMENIYKLSNLEELTLAYWTSPIDEMLKYVSQLKILKNLCFENCSELRDVDILDLVLCHSLKAITLDKCRGILGRNFHHIADELEHLTSLTFIECDNLRTFHVTQLQKLFPYLKINFDGNKAQMLNY
ncbi:F-box/LRR-repeat protein 20-like [Bacillus rossius redtenbacheri]|uniref:F-box/LRR-repeat protein 20-like n=1 Tax=Bacillus rossius redtenbacheri TaxID=93214 RepID=UPI002FDD741C